MTTDIRIIGIAGASGAGKSLLANELHQRMESIDLYRGSTQILNEDCYYRDRSELAFEDRENINYDHPDALEHELLKKHLKQLRSGQPADIPQYDYSQHNRRPESKTIHPSRIILLEGILLLHDPEIRQLMDLKVFVDVALDICLMRRLKRDINERGRSIDSILQQYENTVRPMYFQFIEPTKDFADIIIPRGGGNLSALDVLTDHLQGILHSAANQTTH